MGVSREQREQWGESPANALATSPLTGIAFTPQETARMTMGLREGFTWAASMTLKFGKCRGMTLMQAAATEYGLGWMNWLYTKGTIQSMDLKRAFDCFMADARVVAAVKVMMERNGR